MYCGTVFYTERRGLFELGFRSRVVVALARIGLLLSYPNSRTPGPHVALLAPCTARTPALWLRQLGFEGGDGGEARRGGRTFITRGLRHFITFFVCCANRHAPTSTRSIGFCVIWVSITEVRVRVRDELVAQRNKLIARPRMAAVLPALSVRPSPRRPRLSLRASCADTAPPPSVPLTIFPDIETK